MAQNYTRQSTLSDGDTITASLFNDEYNQLVNAFTYSSTSASSTGHRHDGSSGQGGNIFKIGDLDFLNKIEVDSTNNRWGFYVEVSSAAVEQIRIQDGSIVPVTTNDIDLGTSSLQFKDLYIDGTANVDSLTLTSGATVTTILDEDNLSSDSNTALVTQQSIKAYVDAQVTAQDLDFQADSGGALSIDLDSETMTFTGGTGIDTSGSGNAVTFAIDSTVATLTGTQTLTNKTLTSPDVNTPDIDGGTIDGTVIGGATPAAVSATTISATGNITVGGTVDGRDVATDGTKLDGIESGATADQTAAEIRTLVESASDSNVFTDADHSKLDGIEASADVTDTANVTAAGALMDSELTSIASVKALNQGVATTDSPTFAAVTVNGNVEFDGLSGTGSVTVTDILDQDDMSGNSATALATQQSIKAYVDSQVATADTLSEVLANGNTTGGTNIAFGDNDKAVFGAGSDLEILSQGTDALIRNGNATAEMRIESDDRIVISDRGFNEAFAVFNDDSDVKLYHDGSQKFATTSTGIDVTGTVTADGLTVDGNATFTTADNTAQLTLVSTDTDALVGPQLNLWRNSGTGTNGDLIGEVTFTGEDTVGATNTFATISAIAEQTNNGSEDGSLHFKTLLNGTLAKRLSIGAGSTGGDISFYEDTGTTAKLFWDASAESLGIGTSSPATRLHLSGGDPSIRLTPSGTNDARIDFTNNAGTVQYYTGFDESSGHYIIADENGFAGSNVFTFTSAGNVGIGTSSPTSLLHLSGTYPKITLNDETGVDRAFSVGTNNETFTIRNETGSADVLAITNTNNVGIGTSSPAYKLQANGSGTIARFTDGTSHMDFYAGSNLNEIATASPLLLSVGGTERMRIDSSGRVGIGTSSPAELFVLNKSSGDTFVRFDKSGTFKGLVGISDSSGSGSGSAVAGDVILRSQTRVLLDTGGTTRAVVDASGNVGIGTSSPSQALHVAGAGSMMLNESTSWSYLRLKSPSANGGYIQFADAEDDDVGQIFYYHGAGGNYMSFTTNASEAMRIDSSGNVGIGTSSIGSSTKLQVAGRGLFTDGLPDPGDGSPAGVAIGYNTSSGYGFIQAIQTGVANKDLYVQPSGANNVIIANSGGNVGIGTSSPATALHVKSTTAVTATIEAGGGGDAVLDIKAAEASGGESIIKFSDSVSGVGFITYAQNDGGSDYMRFGTASTERMRIDSSGNVGIGVTSVGTKLDISTEANKAGLRVTAPNTTNQSFGGTISAGTSSSDYALNVNNAAGGNLFRIRGDGNVGIGTSSPDAKIHGVGTQGSGDVPFIFENSATSGVATSSIVFAGNGGGGAEKARIKSAVYGDGYMAFHTNDDSEKMRLDASGNLLVGLTSVSGIATGSTADNGIYLDGANGAVVAQSSANKNLYVSKATGFSDPDFISFQVAGSSVGSIGVISTDNLFISGNATNHAGLALSSNVVLPMKESAYADAAVDLGVSSIRFKDLYLSGVAYASYVGSSGDTDTSIAFDTANSIRFSTAGSEAARFDSSGNLLVGTTSTLASAKFSVVGPATATQQVAGFHNPATSGTRYFLAFGTEATYTERGYITYDGTNVAFTQASDISLKENIRDLNGGLDLIAKIKPKVFDWKDGRATNSVGFIAQEVEEVKPEWVKEKDGIKMIDTNLPNTIPYLIKAIQEQTEIINDLRARVAQLEGAN